MSDDQTILDDTAPAAAPAVAPDFLSSLSEDLRSEASLKDFKDKDALAKSYVSLSKLQGSSVRLPGEDAGTEDLSAFYAKIAGVKGVMRAPDEDSKEAMDAHYKRMGRPDKAEDYDDKITAEHIPAGLSFDRDMLNTFKKTAHDLGLTRKQAEGVLNFELDRYGTMQEQQTLSLDQAKETLRGKWGQAYKARKSSVAAVKRHYLNAHPEYMAQLEQLSGTNPVLAMIMADAGNSLSESGHITNSKQYDGVSSPAEARAKIDEIRNNSEHAWHKKDASGHDAAKAKMRKLYQALTAGT